MEDDYIIDGVSPEEYRKLRLLQKSLSKAAKNDLNEFAAKFWGPRIRNVNASVGYDSKSRDAYMVFGSEKHPRIFRNPDDFSEAEKLVAFNMRYQLKKALKEIRKEYSD